MSRPEENNSSKSLKPVPQNLVIDQGFAEDHAIRLIHLTKYLNLPVQAVNNILPAISILS